MANKKYVLYEIGRIFHSIYLIALKYCITVNYFVFSMISMKLSAFRLAPPMSAPSISG